MAKAAENKTAVKAPATKAQLMRAAMGIIDRPVLQLVPGIEPMDGVYVKAFTAKEYRDLSARGESFDDLHDDGYNDERRMALEMFDADGVQLFDPENMEDVLFLAKLPFSIRQAIAHASLFINTPDGLKNALAAGKSSS